MRNAPKHNIFQTDWCPILVQYFLTKSQFSAQQRKYQVAGNIALFCPSLIFESRTPSFTEVGNRRALRYLLIFLPIGPFKKKTIGG